MSNVTLLMNEYQVTYDEGYVLSSVDRYRRQKRVYPWFIVTKVICALGLSALLAVIVYGVVSTTGQAVPLILIAVVISSFLALLVQGPRLDYFFLKRRLQKSSFYGDDTRIGVSGSGVSISTPKSQTVLQWSAFTKATRVRGGFLVFCAPAVFHWWPDDALVAGTVEDVWRLVTANVGVCEPENA